jgi:hypothetical protein
MSVLIPIKYNKRKYPDGISPMIQEIAGHFDKEHINPVMDYSLHTEYSFGERILENPLLENLSIIRKAHKNHIPKLWTSTEWAKEFFEFVTKLIGNNRPPRIIEIHPPFDDYCPSIEEFVERYLVFERKILASFPKTEIIIENRMGSYYRGGKFILSTSNDLFHLHRLIKGLELKIVLDIPQLFTSCHLSTGRFTKDEIVSVIRSIEKYKKSIVGIHIWGKKITNNRIISHMGTLDTYFGDKNLKKIFLETLFDIFDDKTQRYFIPEVNSSDEDLASIIHDFTESGFIFV